MKDKIIYIDAKDIVVGDKIYTSSYGLITVEKVEKQKKANPIKITFNKYNFLAFKTNDKLMKNDSR